MKIIPKTFYALDLSRFVAAITVLIWHYQHFYMMPSSTFIREEQPFFDFFELAYTNGYMAVQYFWVLSGFVFFHTYFNKINENKISVREYVLNRFSRLYPLHFLTLLLTAFLAYLFFYYNDYFFIYKYNDVKHFLLNLFLISEWGFHDGASFNAPIWSVSVEIFSYIIFFVYCRVVKSNVVYSFLMVAGAYALNKLEPNPLFYCMACFFIGGVGYHVYTMINKFDINPKIQSVACVVLFILALYLHYILSFLVVVLSLALLQTANHDMFKRGKILGDLSFGVYLWHFPIQLCFVIFVSQSVDFYNNDIIFVCFIVLSSLLAYASFFAFEKPVNMLIRNGSIYKGFKFKASR